MLPHIIVGLVFYNGLKSFAEKVEKKDEKKNKAKRGK